VAKPPTIHLYVISFPQSSVADRATGLDYPYVTALLPDQTIQVHNIESQEIAQVVPAPPLPSPNETSLSALLGQERRALTVSPHGFIIPSQQQPEKLRLKKVNLLSRNAKPGGREAISILPIEKAEDMQQQLDVTEDADPGAQIVQTPASTTPYEV
jgi:vacuolar protein sorting-associated protein 3